MKQIFTQSACLFWALLLFVLCSSSAYAQEVVKHIDFNTTANATSGVDFELVTIDNANTLTFETQTDDGLDGRGAYIRATNGNSDRYLGLIRLKDPILFEKGFIYTVTLKARSGTLTGTTEAAGRITFFTNANSNFPASGLTTFDGATPHGADFIANLNYASTPQVEIFNSNILEQQSQNLYVGFRLYIPVSNKANKSYMFVDDIVITKNACPTVAKPTVTSSPAVCGEGTFTFTAEGSPTGNYRWYTSPTDATHIAGITGASYTPPSLTATTTYYVTSVNSNGCESERTAITAIINSIPNAPTTASSNSRCGTGIVTLQVAGASTGQSYRWYNQDGTLITGQRAATYNTPVISATTTYYASIVSSSGCESPKKEVIATIIPASQVTGRITSFPEQPEIGVESTFTVESNVINNNDAASIEWFVIIAGEKTGIGRSGETSVKYTPLTKEEFEIECEINFKPTACYNASKIIFTTKSISPLPVEIIYFTAAKQGNNVLLEWATASEENNTGFEVQVSQDGFNFRKLDFVPTKNGNTVIKQVYTFKDTENGKYGTRYYRLKQLDMDGQFEYFTTKAVSFGEVSNYSLKAFPNPFEGEVNLELNADESGKLNVQVLDAMGRSVMTQQFEVSKGRSLEKITLWQSLPKGIYFVRTEMNGQANNFKLLKK